MKSSQASSAPVRYESLDFWRGVACLSVVLYHSVLLHLSQGQGAQTLGASIVGTLGKLWIGVPLFFVISGYCIAAAADRASCGSRGAGDFFVRRFRRIYPPLWAVIALSVVFFFLIDVAVAPGLLSSEPWAQLRPWWYSVSQWIGNLTLTETWRPYVFGSARGHFPGQAWTLCYEEQFYAIMGLLLLVAPRRIFEGALVVTAFTIGMLALSRLEVVKIQGLFFDGNWLMFAAGVLVYLVVTRGTRHVSVIGSLLLGLGVLSSQWIPPRGAGVAFGFAFLLIWLRPWDRWLATHWALAPITACGRMCYSLYLVHELIARTVSAAFARAGLDTNAATLLITVPTCVAASVAAAIAFHVTVERRFLNSSSEGRTASIGRATTVPQPLSIGAQRSL